MKKIYLLILLCLVYSKALPQISAIDVNRGSAQNNVTDVIIVFKMHFDIGYTGWAEGVLQKNKDDLLLRLWEQAGMGGEVTITLPESFRYKKAMLCNLRNVKLGKEIKITGQKLRLSIDANAPATLLLTAQ